MFKNVVNNKDGNQSPFFTLEMKYLSYQGSIKKQSDGSYPITSSDALLIKLIVSKFPRTCRATKTDFNLQLCQICSGTRFKLHQTTADSYKKKKNVGIVVNGVIDEVKYADKSAQYKYSDTISFDLTKFMYDQATNTSQTFYFVLKADNPFNIYDTTIQEKGPYLQMTVATYKGLNALYEFDQEDNGFAGVSSINLANGKMIHKVEAMQVGNDTEPVSFHLFHSRENVPNMFMFGTDTFWRFSGDYTAYLGDGLTLIDPSGKDINLVPCTAENIKDTYGIKPIEPFACNYFMCLDEIMYAIVDKKDLDHMIFVDKSKNKMLFARTPSGHIRMIKLELNNGKSINYDYKYMGKLFQITNSSGDIIRIVYDDYYIKPIRADSYNKKGTKLGSIVFSYNGDDISALTSYSGDGSTEINKATFTYDAEGRLITVNENSAGMGSQFQYGSNDQVVKVTHNFLGDSDKQKFTTYDYLNFQTRVTDYTGFYKDYYFDLIGRCRCIIDSEGKSITRNYDEIVNGNIGNMTGESNLQINERNVIENNSFDSSETLFGTETGWQKISGSDKYFKIIDGGVYGQKCLQINKGTESLKFQQVLKNIDGGAYTLKAFFKSHTTAASSLSSGDIKAVINVRYTEKQTISTSRYGNSNSSSTTQTVQYVNREKEYCISNKLGGTFEWTAFENNSVFIPYGSNISNLVVTLYVELSGQNYKAYIDDLSLSYGSHIVRHNYVKNGYFENGLSDWTISGNNNATASFAKLGHSAVLGNQVFKFKSNNIKKESIKQTVNIQGQANEELVFSVFGKGVVSKNEVFQAEVAIHYQEGGYKYYTFDFDNNYSNWQVLTRKLVAERAYDFITIEIFARSLSDTLIDAVQLYKDSFGKEYSYTSKKSLAEISSAQGYANISYDDDEKVKEVTDESGDTYRYIYNDNKDLVQITTNQNSRVLYQYENGKRVETKLVSSIGEVLTTKEKFDDLGQTTAQIDECGNTTRFAYDSVGKQTQKTDANGLVTKYEYNAYNLLQKQISQLGSDKSQCTYTYDKYGNIDTIKTLNGTTYKFTYTCDQQVANVSVDGIMIVSNYYGKQVNGINTNLLTKQKLGINDSCGYFDFTYDKKQRLSKVKFNSVDQVQYLYNEKDQLCEVFDCVNNVKKYFSYDNNGNIISVTDSEGNYFAYTYDNLQDLQKETVKIGDILRSFDYEYKCEFNEYTPSGYFARLQKAIPDEVIKGGSGTNGVYGAKVSLNTVNEDYVDANDSSALGDKVASLSFKKSNSIISYNMDTFNTHRQAESTFEKYFSNYSWKDNLKTRKTVFGWIKPCGEITGEQRIFAFAARQTTGVRYTVTAKVDGTVEFNDTVSGQKLTTINKLNVGKWNLVGVKIVENKTANTKTVKLVLNDKSKEFTFSDSVASGLLKYFIIGEQSVSISGGSNAGTSYQAVADGSAKMPFRVAYVSVGSTDVSNDDFEAIYKEGKQYLLDGKLNYGASGVTYYNSELYKGYDVVTLNGSLTSLKRIEPKAHTYIDAAYRAAKARMFKFDETGADALHRHVYASYGNLNNLNKGRLSKLSYDLLLADKGTITVRFKAEKLSQTLSERVILFAEQSGSKKCNLYLDNNNNVVLQEENGTKTTIGSAALDRWHFVSLRFNAKDVAVNLDSATVKTITLGKALNLDNCLVHVGCKVETASLKPVAHLNGCLEILAFKDEYATNDEINKLVNNGESVSVRTYYDELGRTSVKEIRTKNKTLTKTYTFKTNGSQTTTKVGEESTFTGENIKYEYDAVGNVTKAATCKNGSAVDSRIYAYDGLSRLKQSIINGKTHTYAYDTNNNISNKDGITYTYDTVIKDRLMSRSDGTTITYADVIASNPTQIKLPNKTLKLTWLGRRLMKVNNVSYAYNESGVRISRTIDGSFSDKYILEGDSIIALQRKQGSQTKVLSFVYDETHMLVGLSYKGNEYFFDRTVNGEIRSIIDKNGTIMVSYSYDDWGKPTITSNGTAIGNELKELNPFMYKGYFFDQDTEMYYLKTRYYSPELGRFISADSEVGSVGNTMGMNMFAYCLCNPINYADENGNWPSWATKLCIGLAVIAVLAVAAAITVATGGAGACLVTSMLVGAIKGAAIGAITGAVIGAATGAISEGLRTGTWEGALRGMWMGAVEGAADGFMWGAIGGAISGAMNPKFCFIAGTLVMTSVGLKAIEDISVGEQVLAYNDDLNTFAYRDVVDSYINETSELVHIHTSDEEIVCTPNHSILTNKGWKQAQDITVEDSIQTVEGFAKVTAVETEKLKTPVKVYNLNVLCYHTYVIGEQQLVVHNACPIKEKGVYELEFNDGRKYIGKGSKQRMQQSIKKWSVEGQRSLVSKRFTPCTNNQTAFMLEHIKMMEAGFGQEGCVLLNSIHSPGMKLILMIM